MASYQGHLMFSGLLGAAYGSAAAWQWEMDWGVAGLGALLTAVGGLLPDLDSDSSVPVRELFGLAATVTPLLLLRRLLNAGLTTEQTLLLLGALYLFIRYGARALLGRLTVHRGMFHSLPAMVIAGLVVFLLQRSPVVLNRLYLAGGIMLGFFSHLLLDELFSVDLLGSKLHLKKHAGSPLKLYSASWSATLVTYGLLAWLVFLVHQELGASSERTWDWRSPFH